MPRMWGADMIFKLNHYRNDCHSALLDDDRPNRPAGREAVLAAYREAIEQRYRFFSYGDAMLIL